MAKMTFLGQMDDGAEYATDGSRVYQLVPGKDRKRAVAIEPEREARIKSMVSAARGGEPAPERSVMGDMGRMMMAGGAGFVGDIGRVTGVKAVEELGDRGEEWWNEGVSPETQAEMQKPFLSEDGGIGPGLTSPTKIAGTIAGSALPMGAGMATGMGLAGAGMKALGMSPGVAGAVGGAVGEGSVAGIMGAGQVSTLIDKIPEEKIVMAEPYQRAYHSLPNTLDDATRRAQAREIVKREAMADVGPLVALATAAFGAPSGYAAGKIIGGEVGKSLLGTMAKQGFLEGVVQEAPQSAAEQALQNRAIQEYADPTQDTNAGIAEAAVGGAVAGTAMGAALSPAAHSAGLAEQAQRPPAPPPAKPAAPPAPPATMGGAGIEAAEIPAEQVELAPPPAVSPLDSALQELDALLAEQAPEPRADVLQPGGGWGALDQPFTPPPIDPGAPPRGGISVSEIRPQQINMDGPPPTDPGEPPPGGISVGDPEEIELAPPPEPQRALPAPQTVIDRQGNVGTESQFDSERRAREQARMDLRQRADAAERAGRPEEAIQLRAQAYRDELTALAQGLEKGDQSFGVTAAQAKLAAKKAVAGEKLGKREADAVNAMLEQVSAEPPATPEPAMPTTAEQGPDDPLTDDDLERLYDEAAAEVYDEKQAETQQAEVPSEAPPAAIDAAAAEAATSPENDRPEPTDAQKEAGNYKKGHAKIAGLDLSIENPAGTRRRAEWPELKSHYGYIKGTVGKDKDHIDVFVKPGTADDWTGQVFVIDQLKKGSKEFDEHKVMLGYASSEEAEAAYLENYTPDWEENIEGMAVWTVENFKEWLASGDTNQPATNWSLAKAAGHNTIAEAEAAIAREEKEAADAEREKREAIDQGFAENRAAMGKFKPGDKVKFLQPHLKSEDGKSDGRWMRGEVAKVSDKEQGIIKVMIGKADYYVAARKLEHDADDDQTPPGQSDKWAEAQSAIEQAIAASEKHKSPNAETAKNALARFTEGSAAFQRGNDQAFALSQLEKASQLMMRQWPATSDLIDQLIEEVKAAPAKAEGKKAKKRAELTRQQKREAERDLYNAISAMEIDTSLTGDALGDHIRELAANYVQQQAAGADEIRARGLNLALEAIDKKFIDAVTKAAKKAAAEREKEKNRDPAALAKGIADAVTQKYPNADVSPERHAAFVAGFHHALAGKTKSTLSGDHLADMVSGYEAGRKWAGTEEGRAWVTGTKRKKLENTGVDLKRWWDKQRALMKAGESDVKKAWDQIQRATARADLFSHLIKPDMKPGLRAYLENARGYTYTFLQYLAETKGLRSDYGLTIQTIIDGDAYPLKGDREKFRTDSAYRADWLRIAAEEYINDIQGFTETFEGAESVAAAAEAFLKKYGREGFVEPKETWAARSDSVLSSDGYDALAKIGNPNDLMDLRPGYRRTLSLIAREDDASLIKSGPAPLRPPRLDRVTREKWPDRRKGKDVTPQEFKEAFGFADVGFGSWVNSKQDQDHLNYAYDAFMDLAEHFGMDPKNVGFGGALHFTIGALGHGKHAAHFQPSQPSPIGNVPVINVTNTRGDGTLYHEWIHALDHFLGGSGEWAAVRSRIQKVFLKGVPTVARVEEFAKSFLVGGSYWSSNKRQSKLTAAMYAMNDYVFERHGLRQTKYKTDADKLGADYWGNSHELLARAGEAWAVDTTEAVNTYLVQPDWAGEGRVGPPAYRGTPYPTGAERKLFNAHLTALSKAIKWEKGTPTVTMKDFDEALRRDSAWVFEGEERRKALKDEANMLEFLRKLQGEAEEQAQTRKQEAEAQKRAEQEEMDRLAAEALAELSPPTPLPDETMGELTDTDLEALFDQAAAELREQTQEKPTAPPPGETLEKYAEKADTEKKDEALGAAVSKHVAEAAKLGVEGISEALTGLTKLFGGGPGRLSSFPGGVDEDTYKQAKPHFEAALKAFQAAGKSLKDLFKFLIEQFGDGVKAYAIRFAKEQGLTNQLGAQVSASKQISDWVLERIKADQQISWQELFEQADKAYGGTQAEGKYTPKDAYDAMEAGMNRWILGSAELGVTDVARMDQMKARMLAAVLMKKTDLLATQSKRTQEMNEFQQFSTVPAFALAANWVANVQPADQVLEPSAGIGGLAVFAQATGAQVVVNELSSRRAAVLREVLPNARVFTENAEQLHNILPDDVAPSVVVMNPPFSATAGRVEGQRDTMNGALHLEQALKRLVPGGRLVAIVGEGMALDRPAFKGWWSKIREKYDVRAVIPVDGRATPSTARPFRMPCWSSTRCRRAAGPSSPPPPTATTISSGCWRA